MATMKATSSSSWPSNWNPDEDFCQNGPGVEGEGKIVQLRFHTVTAKDRVERYIAAVMKVHCCFAITKDKYGAEVAIDPKKYPEGPSALSFDALAEVIKPPQDLLDEDLLSKLHPQEPGHFEFWAAATTDARKWNEGDEIHFKTKGNSMFLKHFFHASLGNFSHLEGGQVMQQLSAVSENLAKKGPMAQDLAQGCDSDEWSD